MKCVSSARRIAREHGGIVIMDTDYLQLMRVPALSDNRTLEIAEISRSPALAKELERWWWRCPVLKLFSGTTCRQTPGQSRLRELALSSRMRT